MTSLFRPGISPGRGLFYAYLLGLPVSNDEVLTPIIHPLMANGMREGRKPVDTRPVLLPSVHPFDLAHRGDDFRHLVKPWVVRQDATGDQRERRLLFG